MMILKFIIDNEDGTQDNGDNIVLLYFRVVCHDELVLGICGSQ